MTDTPSLTSKNLPKPPLPPQPATQVVAEIPYADIEAKPLRAPNFISLKHKNPNMSLFWGNRAVGEKESGLRYDQLIAMGFVPARPDEITQLNGQPVPPSLQRDGRVMYGDLILLKLPKVDYVGALKWNEQNARLRVKKPGVTIETGASQDIKDASALRSDANDARKSMSPAGFPKKVSTYVPQITEVDSKTADNSGPDKINLAEKS